MVRDRFWNGIFLSTTLFRVMKIRIIIANVYIHSIIATMSTIYECYTLILLEHVYWQWRKWYLFSRTHSIDHSMLFFPLTGKLINFLCFIFLNFTSFNTEWWDFNFIDLFTSKFPLQLLYVLTFSLWGTAF